VPADTNLPSTSDTPNLCQVHVEQIETLQLQLHNRDLELGKCRQEINKLNEAIKATSRHVTIKEAELDVEKLRSLNLDKKIEMIAKELQENKQILKKLCNKFSLNNVKQKIETLTYYTGFDDINIFNGYYEFVVPKNKHPIIEDEKKAKLRASVISVDDELLLVLAKFRQNFDNIDLSA
jgi:hypothetical protein